MVSAAGLAAMLGMQQMFPQNQLSVQPKNQCGKPANHWKGKR